jgi:hypothetical protein
LRTCPPDDFGKVAEFYRGRYPAPRAMRQAGGQGSPGVLVLVISSFPETRDVMASEDRADGGTRIVLRHHTGRKPTSPKKAGA